MSFIFYPEFVPLTSSLSIPRNNDVIVSSKRPNLLQHSSLTGGLDTKRRTQILFHLHTNNGNIQMLKKLQLQNLAPNPLTLILN